MSLRTGSAIVSQIGLETTPGIAVPANRLLKTVSFNLRPRFTNQTFRAQGFRVPTSNAKHKKWGSGDYEGVLDYNSINYILAGLFNNPAATQIGTLQAYERIFIAGQRSLDSNRKTFTFEKGDATAADQYAFGQLTSFSMEATQDEFSVKGDVIARYPTVNGVLTPTPTEIAERPVERDDIKVYVDDSFAAIGTTPFTEVMKESFDLGSKFKEVFFHNRGTPEFMDVIEIPYEPKFMFSTHHNAQSRALLASIASNPKKYIRWEAYGASLGTHSSVEYFERIWIDMAVKFSEPQELLNDDEPYGYDYECTLEADTAMGTHLRVQTISSLASL